MLEASENVPDLVPVIKARKIPDTQQREFSDWWLDAFLLATGEPYAFEGGKDAVHVLAMLKYAKGDMALMKRRAMSLLESEDQFYREKGINLALLRSTWNKLGSMRPSSQKLYPFETALEANARDLAERINMNLTPRLST